MGKGSTPKPPDYEDAARQGVYADLETYPLRYLTEAASKMGGKVTIDGKEYDFTGLGDADNSKVMSDKMAQTLLDIQRNLGPQYVAQRLEELKQADPKGYAARKDLFDRIMQQADQHPDRPLAEDLQNSIVTELQSAGRLDQNMLNEVQQSVRGGQVGRGNYLGTAATAQEAGAVVGAGDRLRDQQQQQALGFLESGVTPEDVEYRRLQQSLSNLGNFVQGQTPTAEFRSLSGAGNGAAPFVGGGPNSQFTNPNAGQQGVNNALNIYSGNVNWAANQVNPYVAGISTALSAAGAATNMGWKPFASSPGSSAYVSSQYPGDM
jgi:hypothetical protein